jgi:RNA polymerase sigma-70 factor (ECF subfamily)
MFWWDFDATMVTAREIAVLYREHFLERALAEGKFLFVPVTFSRIFAVVGGRAGMVQPDPESGETERLLRQAQAGDRRALEELFGRYRPYLHQVVAVRLDASLRARLDPSDVVQEAEADAFRRLPDFLSRQPMSFRLWLRKTAQERLLKLREQHINAARRSVAGEVRLPDRSSALLARRLLGGSTPSQRLSQKETARRINEALGQLAEPYREMLLMRHYEELSYEEIGSLLEIEAATARKRYGRALLRLQKLLVDSGLLDSRP